MTQTPIRYGFPLRKIGVAVPEFKSNDSIEVYAENNQNALKLGMASNVTEDTTDPSSGIVYRFQWVTDKGFNVNLKEIGIYRFYVFDVSGNIKLQGDLCVVSPTNNRTKLELMLDEIDEALLANIDEIRIESPSGSEIEVVGRDALLRMRNQVVFQLGKIADRKRNGNLPYRVI